MYRVVVEDDRLWIRVETRLDRLLVPVPLSSLGDGYLTFAQRHGAYFGPIIHLQFLGDHDGGFDGFDFYGSELESCDSRG